MTKLKVVILCYNEGNIEQEADIAVSTGLGEAAGFENPMVVGETAASKGFLFAQHGRRRGDTID